MHIRDIEVDRYRETERETERLSKDEIVAFSLTSGLRMLEYISNHPFKTFQIKGLWSQLKRDIPVFILFHQHRVSG